MIYLESADTLSAEASVASAVTVTTYGRPLLLSTFAKLDQRQLATGTQTLYTSQGTETNIDEIVLVNPTGSACIVTLWHDGVANSNMILPPVSIGPGEFAIYDDSGWHFYTALGQLKTTETVIGIIGNAKINAARSSSAVSFANSVAENTLATYTIPGGEPVAGDVYTLDASGTIFNNTGANVTYLWRLKYGATTLMATIAMPFTTSASRRRWTIKAHMLFETTSAEEMWAELLGTATGSGETWSLLGTSESALGQSSAAESSATGKAFALTCQMGTASVNADIFREAYVFERHAV